MKSTVAYMAIARSLLRVPTYLLLLMYLVIGYWTGLIVSHHTGTQLFGTTMTLFACALVIALWYIAGSGMNDYADYEIDQINLMHDKCWPLVSGAATKQTLRRVITGSIIIALLVAALISWSQALLAAVLIALSASYLLRPFQISRRGGLAPIMLPLGYIILPFYSGFMLISHNYFNPVAIGVVIAYYLHFIGRIILKDYRDVKGDAVHNKRTFLLRHGNASVCIVSATTTVISSALIIVSLHQQLGVLQYAVAFFACYALFMLYSLSQVQQWRQQKPLLAAFGRAMTGITTITIFGLVTSVSNLSSTITLVGGLAIVIVYSWSAQQAFIYNRQRLAQS